MAALQLKAALLILGIAAGRKLLFRFFSPRLPEWLWILVGIRLLLPQGIGIPILSVRHLCAPYPCDPFAAPLPGVAVWVRWSGAGAVLLILLANALRFYGRMRQKEDLQNDAVSGWIQAHSRGPRFRVYTSSMAGDSNWKPRFRMICPPGWKPFSTAMPIPDTAAPAIWTIWIRPCSAHPFARKSSIIRI